jgi:adenylate cyclase class IV
VKFHFDVVENLGTFIEVEAIDEKDEMSMEDLKEQCQFYLHFFELSNTQLIDQSYSDLMLERN